jgi:hypothetical protein
MSLTSFSPPTIGIHWLSCAVTNVPAAQPNVPRQRTFGALSVSRPVIDTLEPVSGSVIGAFVFGERLAASPAQLADEAVAGIAALSRFSVAAMEARTGDPASRAASNAPQVPRRPQ